MRKNEYQVYSELLTFDWNAVFKATQIITLYITSMELDEMKIEFLFLKLFKTIEKLKEQKTKIADDLLAEFKKVFDQNINLLVPFSAFLLTCEGSKFWQNFPKAYQYYFMPKGWCGIVFFLL